MENELEMAATVYGYATSNINTVEDGHLKFSSSIFFSFIL